jgi:Domain of unknown function (DUF4188)
MPRRTHLDFVDSSLFPWKWILEIRTMIGMGFLLGSLFAHCLGFPLTAALGVSALLLLPQACKFVGILVGFYDQPLRKLVVPGRHTAIVREGNFVVFHIGAMPNRSMDMYFKWMGNAMDEMQKELEEHPEYGCWGIENYVGTTGILSIRYWESLEALNGFARNASAKHKSRWTELFKVGQKSSDYGFWHEAFLVQNGKYETIYNHCPPLLLGNARGVSLVPARGKYQSAAGRAGDSDGTDYPKDVGFVPH